MFFIFLKKLMLQWLSHVYKRPLCLKSLKNNRSEENVCIGWKFMFHKYVIYDNTIRWFPLAYNESKLPKKAFVLSLFPYTNAYIS